MTGTRVCISGQNGGEVMLCPQRTTSRVHAVCNPPITVDIDLDHLTQVVSAGLPHCNVDVS